MYTQIYSPETNPPPTPLSSQPTAAPAAACCCCCVNHICLPPPPPLPYTMHAMLLPGYSPARLKAASNPSQHALCHLCKKGPPNWMLHSNTHLVAPGHPNGWRHFPPADRLLL
jgi:hypothetical protein